jgi:hypothetical protein
MAPKELMAATRSPSRAAWPADWEEPITEAAREVPPARRWKASCPRLAHPVPERLHARWMHARCFVRETLRRHGQSFGQGSPATRSYRCARAKAYNRYSSYFEGFYCDQNFELDSMDARSGVVRKEATDSGLYP